jgi:hypothetical protein
MLNVIMKCVLMLIVHMLNVIILKVLILKVVMLCVLMLSVHMPNAIMLSVLMLNVVAPFDFRYNRASAWSWISPLVRYLLNIFCVSLQVLMMTSHRCFEHIRI